MDIFRVFQVEAAHRLPNVPEGHKCARLHGHSFRIEVHVSGPVEEPDGWVMDFADLRRIFQPVYDQLDHRYLNELEPFREINPTAENIAAYMYREISARLNSDTIKVNAVTLWETDRACVRYSEEAD